MKKIAIILSGLLFMCLTSQAYHVIFQVDMTNMTGFTEVQLNGTFNGWCGNCIPMTDANSDNIWEVEVPLEPGNYEYKFTADSWNMQENLTPGSSCTVTNGGYTNRSLQVVDADIVLPVVCWGACTSCSSTQPVTFQVDMTSATFSFSQPTVNGTFNGWSGNANPLSDANSDGVYETTINLAPGTYEFKFATDNWSNQENLTPGSSCTVTNSGYTNRTVTVTDSEVIMSPVCWGSCSACNNQPATYNVSFSVDMSQATGFSVPELNGTFNNWCGNCNAMSDNNSDGIWDIVLALPAGTYEFKYSYDNWAGSEQLQEGLSCTVTNGGYTNRVITINGDTTIPVVCFGLCTQCQLNTVYGCKDTGATNYNPAATVDNGTCTYNTVFNVDMTCADAFTDVYITGPWCGWCAADTYNHLTDADGDGIYSVSLIFPAGNVEYKYMVDNWASQENLIDDMQNGATCAPVTDYANYANRLAPAGANQNDVYGRCSACVTPPTNYNVTFQVDMSQQTGFTTPEVNG
ncbi:MAG: hypothetical protein RL062_1122, partial [Bacteroidota bacterium]